MNPKQLRKKEFEADKPGKKAKKPKVNKPGEGHDEKKRLSRWGKFKDGMKAGLMVAATICTLGIVNSGCGSAAKNGADTGVSQDASGLQDAAPTTDASLTDSGTLDAAIQLDASVLPDAAMPDAAVQQDAAQPDAMVTPDAEVQLCNGAQIADVSVSFAPFVVNTVTAPVGNQNTFKLSYVLGSEAGAVDPYIVMNLYCPDGVTLISGDILPGNVDTAVPGVGGKQVRLKPRSWTANVALVDVHVEDSP